MTTVLHLQRILLERPGTPSLGGVSLRHFQGPADVAVWLDLRHRAFARERIGVRRWDLADFEREFLRRPWWSPERMWFAEELGVSGSGRAIGSVALAERGQGESARPTIHWLAVLPQWRRRGVARLLIASLEQACWDAGRREIVLETHAAWTAAMGFYKALGYGTR